MAIGDDITAYPKQAGTVFRYTASNNNQYTVQAFFSWVMETFNEPGYGVYKVPIKYNTPTYYTMQNGGFLDNGDGSNILEHLKEGAIDTSGYTDDVHYITGDNLTDFVAGDKGKRLYNATHTEYFGEILTYRNDSPTSGDVELWVRDDSNPANPIQNNDAINATQDGGTGSCDADADEASGDEIYSGVYSLAAENLFEGPGNPDGQIYFFQDYWGDGARERHVFATGDQIHDRGEFDVIIPTKIGGTLIDSGTVEIFMRQSGDAFAWVNATLDASYKPVAISTVADSNHDGDEHYLLVDNVAGGSPAVNDVVYHPTTGDAEWYATISYVNNVAGANWLLGLQGLRKKPTYDIVDNDACGNGTWTADVNGTEGDCAVCYDGEVNPLTVGNTITGQSSGAKRKLRGLYDAGTTGYIVMEVDTTVSKNSSYQDWVTDFTENEELNDEGTGEVYVDEATLASRYGIAGFTDVTIAHICGTVSCDTFVGTFTPGEVVTWNAGSSSAIMVYTDGSTTMTLGEVDPTDEPDAADSFSGVLSGASCECNSTLTDDQTETFNFPKKTAYNYSVFVEGGSIYEAGRPVDEIYEYLKFVCRDGSTYELHVSSGTAIATLEGQEYISSDRANYTISKTAPFGTFAGGVFYGAQGVWLEGMASADANNLVLIDHNGNTREPDPSITLTCENTVSGDWVQVLPRDGTAIDYDQFTSAATGNNQGDSDLVIQEAIPNDVPENSYVFVYADGEKEIHPYRVSSWTTSTFTLVTEISGTAEAGSSGNTLVDTGMFGSGIQRGDIIRNSSTGKWGIVKEVTDADTIVTDEESGAPNDPVQWSVGNNFTHNTLVQAYDGSDTVFCAYMCREATSTSEDASILYVSDRNVIVFCRDSGATPIIPFVLDTGTFGNAGATYNIIRITDTVKT